MFGRFFGSLDGRRGCNVVAGSQEWKARKREEAAGEVTFVSQRCRWSLPMFSTFSWAIFHALETSIHTIADVEDGVPDLGSRLLVETTRGITLRSVLARLMVNMSTTPTYPPNQLLLLSLTLLSTIQSLS